MSAIAAARAVRLLLMTDKPVLSEAIKLALNHGAFLPRVASDIEEAASAMNEWRPHVAVVDVDLAGTEVVERLVDRSPASGRVPIIALTQKTDLATKLDVFQKGADDVLTLPFAPDELLARVTVAYRRAYRASMPLTSELTFGDIKINIMTRTAYMGRHKLQLTSMELALLYLLMANPHEPISRDVIMDHIWGQENVAYSNVVDRHIRNLRVKLRNDWRRPRYIFTVPGRGYSFLRPKNGG